ncbi:tRNA pseudouridine(13) synthase TruD [Vibrio sp.]|uniref:tRNA pseudouridine(13) synthase TruD n=1 Tax=Vibrio sp. TaxID=678 RepID=UPI003D1522D8
MSDILSSLAYLHGKPAASAILKAQVDHFQVTEKLGFDFTGQGEHLMVHIRKKGENTAFVANELAKACGVKSKDVSWAGLKDRHAVTEQWLSIHLPKGDNPDFSQFLAQYPQVEILAQDRHNKKLRPGDLVGNDFVIILSQVSDPDEVLARLEKIVHAGVPNYFGAQRFGREGNNVSEARRWGRDNVRTRNQNKRSLYLSAARSWIFNQIVSERIEKGWFGQFVSGDIALQHDQPQLVEAQQLADWNQQLAQGEAAISAAMAGDNALPTHDQALALEQPKLDAEPDLMALIRGNRMRHDRRRIDLQPQGLSWQQQGDQIMVKFALPAGCFATSVIRELVQAEEMERIYSE